MHVSSSTAAKGGVLALLGAGGGTGVYYAVKPRGEFEELDENVVTEESSNRLDSENDWESRESSYFDSYVKVYPDGNMRILYLPTNKPSGSENLIKKWCNRRWEVKRVISLTKYWCYKDKTTWLEKAKTEKNNGEKWELNNGVFTFENGGTIKEYKSIEDKLKEGTDDKKSFDSIKSGNLPQLQVAIEWCKREAGLFYVSTTDAYNAFKENCLKQKSSHE